MTGGYRSGLTKIPTAAGKLLVQTVIRYGVTTTRISDPWNDFQTLREEVDDLRAMGMESVVNLIYTVSPRHTDEYYVSRARDAASLRPRAICFKDVGGLLTPDRARKLIPEVLAAIGATPLEFHCHGNNGLAPLNVIEAVKAGVRTVHCAVPPLASGSSNPSIFNTVSNLSALGYDCAIDVEPLRRVERHFRDVARREKLPIGRPAEYDQTVYLHQIPGGMISNLRHQIAKIGKADRFEEVLAESGRVRADLGYPIMVTPLSQFVGSQAAINVITGERYKQVTDEVIHYALGHWGTEAIDVMDPEVRAKILNGTRARELEASSPPEPSLEDLRRKYGASLSDEQLLLRLYAGEDAVSIAAAHTGVESPVAGRGVVDLIRGLAACDGRDVVSVGGPNLSVTLRRSAGAS
jgi:oxaloacetate decarboxylase alpha subunit